MVVVFLSLFFALFNSQPLYCPSGDSWEKLHIIAKTSEDYNFDGIGKTMSFICFGGKIWDLASGQPKYSLTLTATDTQQTWDLSQLVNKTNLQFQTNKHSRWVLTFQNKNSLWNADLNLTINWQIENSPDLSDMGFTACKQFCSQWCWATVTAELSAFLEMKPLNCVQSECMVESWMTQCGGNPPSCCCGFNQPDCTGNCNSPATLEQVVTMLEYYIPNYSFTSTGPLDQDIVYRVLGTNQPIEVLIKWDGGGGHAIVILGVSGFGYNQTPKLKIADPLTNSFTQVTYNDLLHYQGVGTWIVSLYVNQLSFIPKPPKITTW